MSGQSCSQTGFRYWCAHRRIFHTEIRRTKDFIKLVRLFTNPKLNCNKSALQTTAVDMSHCKNRPGRVFLRAYTVCVGPGAGSLSSVRIRGIDGITSQTSYHSCHSNQSTDLWGPSLLTTPRIPFPLNPSLFLLSLKIFQNIRPYNCYRFNGIR